MFLQKLITISVLLALLVGGVVFLEKKIVWKDKIFFLGCILGIFLWSGGIIFNFRFPAEIIYEYGDMPYIVMQVLYFGATLILFSQYWFFSFYKNKNFKFSINHYISLFMGGLMVVFLVLPDVFFSTVEFSTERYTILNREIGINFFVVYLFFFYFSSLFTLLRRIKLAKNPIYKLQLQYLLGIFLLLTTSAILTNMILPTYFNSPQFNLLGPVFYIVEAFSFFYAVTKLRFFDIQLVAQKYATHLSNIFVYASPLLVLLYFFRGQGEISVSLVAGVMLLSLALTILFWNKTNHFFDKFWNMVFYQDKKNPLQKIRAGIKGFQNSVTDGLNLLAQVMHIKEAQFVLVGDMDANLTNFFTAHPTNELVRDEVEFELEVRPHAELKKIKSTMDKYLISVAIPIFDNNKKLLGIVLLKQKLEGGLFSVQEIRETRVMLEEATIYLTSENESEQIEKRLQNRELVSKEFLNNLLHEIKTPLMVAQNVKEMIEWKRLQPEDQEFLSESDESIQELTRKLDRITEAFQWQQGLITLEKSYLSLDDLFAFLRREFEEQVEFEIMPKSLGEKLFFMDIKAIKMAFEEIIKNSIFFNKTDRLDIKIRVEEKNKKIILFFQDNGVGIDRKHWNSIYDLLFVVAESRNPIECGLGVGLTKAKGIIEAHNGTIAVIESQKGEGTVFQVELPIEKK